MEKLMYALWRTPADDPGELRERLLGPVADALFAAGVHSLRLCLDDEHVAPAAALRQINTRPAADAVLSLWVDSATRHVGYEALVAPHVAGQAGYLVCESAPISPAGRAEAPDGRLEGMCQVVFLQRPPRLAWAEWIRIWQGSHTEIAIATQASFGYRQNVVVRPLGDAAAPWDAIVEENFPAEAMDSPEAFFDAVGDPGKCRANQTRLMESCQRFIDFDRIEVLPMSEYNRASTAASTA